MSSDFVNDDSNKRNGDGDSLVFQAYFLTINGQKPCKMGILQGFYDF
jgi:hypothetical protein